MTLDLRPAECGLLVASRCAAYVDGAGYDVDLELEPELEDGARSSSMRGEVCVESMRGVSGAILRRVSNSCVAGVIGVPTGTFAVLSFALMAAADDSGIPEDEFSPFSLLLSFSTAAAALSLVAGGADPNSGG